MVILGEAWGRYSRLGGIKYRAPSILITHIIVTQISGRFHDLPHSIIVHFTCGGFIRKTISLARLGPPPFA